MVDFLGLGVDDAEVAFVAPRGLRDVDGLREGGPAWARLASARRYLGFARRRLSCSGLAFIRAPQYLSRGESR